LPTTTDPSTAKYVYGVVRAAGPSTPDVRGIGDEPVGVVALDDLGALSSDVPDDDLEAGREELLAHARVLEAVIEEGVVLPMRFGVVLPDEEAVRQNLLAAHRVELAEQLDEMDSKVELDLKGIYEEPAVLSEIVAENVEVADLREAIRDKPEEATYYERIRLGEVVAEALGAKRSADEQAILDRLAGHAVAIEVGEAVHERMAVNASFLVDRAERDAFDSAVDEIGAEQANRIRFKLTGPLAPHSFVELAVGTVEA
jgi:hypothetical protein